METIREFGEEHELDAHPPVLDHTDIASVRPPSFAQSEFQTIVRRQRHGLDPDGLKIGHKHQRHLHLNNSWEFSGWGSMRYLDITPSELSAATTRLNAPRYFFHELAAMSVAGNDVSGSVFYTFPLVAAVAGVYSPICLVLACLLLVPIKPLLLELACAIRLNGGNYIYLLQFAGKAMSIIGAAATLLDAICTTTVSAATASAYLEGEFVHLPISPSVITILMLVGMALFAFAGLKERATLATAIFSFHLLTMSVLAMASAIHWGRSDSHSEVLRANWASRPGSALDSLRALFYGTCVAFLGVTGFECVPCYVESIRPKTYPAVLRNLIVIVTVLNGTIGIFAFAVLPLSTIRSGANILSALAETAVGKWLRVLVVVDAVLVLLGGILTGLLTSGQLLDRLARDHVLPPVFLRQFPVTGTAYVSTISALGLSVLLYVASGLNLATVSSIFSIAFLFVLFLYALSALLLKLNRPNLPAESRAGTLTLLGAFVAVIATWVGNIVLNPTSLGLFAASFAIILVVFFLVTAQPSLLRFALHLHAASPFARYRWTRGWADTLVKWYQRSRNSRVCVWVKDDNFHTMLQALLSVQRNAPDAQTVVLVHAYPSVEQIPSELHANTMLLDEAFPSMTIDLTFVQGTFSPVLVEAASQALDIARSRMCMVSLGKDHGWELADYGGVRVIM